jgi:itaconate CoA-transferase
LVTQVFEAPELADDPRFSTNVQRVRHRAGCDAVVAEHTSDFFTDDLTLRLAAAGVPAAQVSQLEDVVDHPQLRARDRWRQIGTEHGAVNALLPPATFDDVEARMGDVPALGQHTYALVIESGMDADAAEYAMKNGIAVQAERFLPVSIA